MRVSAILMFLLMQGWCWSASACEPLERYTARLGPRDHYNSYGEPLNSPAAIIRQDRANFHKFGVRDSEDESDEFFAVKDNRERLERMLDQAWISSRAAWTVVNDTPLVEVTVCAGDRVEVRVR